MGAWVRLHTKWILDRGLDQFEGRDGVIALKVFYALALARGAYQSEHLREASSFPASLELLADRAHVSRTHASQGLAKLRQVGLIGKGASAWQAAGVGRRTSFHEFLQTEGGFFAFPFEHVHRSNLLRNARVFNRVCLGALKAYLLLGALRNTTSGVSRIGYNRLESGYGFPRDVIRASIDLLINTSLVAVDRPEQRDQTNSYRILGISTRRRKAE